MAAERTGVDPERVRAYFQKLFAMRLSLQNAGRPSDGELQRHGRFHNTVYYDTFKPQGDLLMKPGMAYRFVGVEALNDLAEVGFVRNGEANQKGPENAWDHRVFWSTHARSQPYRTPQPNDDQPSWITFASNAYIEAPLETVQGGLVTIEDVTGIYIKDPDTEQVINLLEK